MKITYYEKTVLILVILALFVPGLIDAGEIKYKIVTGNPKLTYFKIGNDLAELIAPDAKIDLTVVPTKGSVQNVQDMRYAKGVKFALVQHDVYQRYLDLALENPKAADLITYLRVILPLYFEEVHFIARAGAKIDYVHEIENKRINIGAKKSGSAMTAIMIYRQIFGKPIPKNKQFNESPKEALRRLLKNEIDVAVIVAGQPTGVLSKFKKNAGQVVKLLSVDKNNPVYNTVLKNYYHTSINKNSYLWLDRDYPCLGVKAYLITYNYPQPKNRKYIRQFAISLGNNFDKLQKNGHKKWKQVSRKLGNLPSMWKYYPVTKEAMCRSGVFICPQSGLHSETKSNAGNCPDDMKALGLCK